MCPPASPLGPDCTGRDIFKVLDPAQPGDHIPLPSDVQTGINLHEYHPENLPGIANGCWYLLRSPFKMETDTGFWKATGDARRIYSDGRVSGWESTREFYEPNDHRTHWVMQEYTITHNVPNLLEGYGSLCRVFFCHGENGDHRSPQSQIGVNFRGDDPISSTNERIISSDPVQLSLSQVNVGNGEVIRLDDYLRHGDYLALGDLGVSYSSSSSSANSCRPSVSSDELFDFLEVDDLTPEISQEIRPESTGTSSGLAEVVVSPDTEGTMVSSNRIDSRVESLKRGNSSPGTTVKEKNIPDEGGSQHAGQSRAPKKARNVLLTNLNEHSAAPSSSQDSAPVEHKEMVVRKKKRKNKYFCFMPF